MIDFSTTNSPNALLLAQVNTRIAALEESMNRLQDEHAKNQAGRVEIYAQRAELTAGLVALRTLMTTGFPELLCDYLMNNREKSVQWLGELMAEKKEVKDS